jgi:hypothetical protein
LSGVCDEILGVSSPALATALGSDDVGDLLEDQTGDQEMRATFMLRTSGRHAERLQRILSGKK